MNLSERVLILDEFAQRREDSRFRTAVNYADARAEARAVQRKSILLEARGKKSGALSALLAHMLGDSQLADYEFIWVSKGPESSETRLLTDDPRVRSVGFRTREYAHALWTAGVLVSDRAFPSFVTKRPEQTGVIVWSTPPPSLSEVPGPACPEELKNVARSLLHTDVLVTPDRSTAEALLDATGVRAVFPGAVAVCATPAETCHAVFGAASSVEVWRPEATEKTRLIVLGCDFGDVPATFEVIGLSHSIDHDHYDLTVLLAGKAVPDRERRVGQLHAATRVLYTFGHRPLTRDEYVNAARHKALAPDERCADGPLAAVAPLYARERRRLLGDVRFDVALGFTDRLTEATLLLACSPFDHRVLCLTDPAEQVSRRLSPGLVAARFANVLVTPQADGSRTQRGVESLAGDRPRIARVDRFAGYETSVRALHDELAAQLFAALGGTGVPPEVHDALEALTHAVLEHSETVQGAHGVNPRTHNATVMAAYRTAVHAH